MLMHYQSDAKGILAKHIFVTTAAESSFPVTRGGNQLAGFLTERAFVITEKKEMPSGFDHEILLLMPRVMKDGKGASVCPAAQDVVLGIPHQLGHRHLSASHYCVDGAMLEPFSVSFIIGITCGGKHAASRCMEKRLSSMQ